MTAKMRKFIAMRKYAAIALMIVVVIFGGVFGTMLIPDSNRTNDAGMAVNNKTEQIDGVTHLTEEQLESILEGCYDIGDVDPALVISGMTNPIGAASAAGTADIHESGLQLMSADITARVNVLKSLIQNFECEDGEITFLQGTGAKLTGSTDDLEELIASRGKEVSFLAIRLRDGAGFGYNIDEFRESYSIVKAPVSYYCMQLVEAGKLSLDTKYTYTREEYNSGSGRIKNYPYGTKFTLKTILDYAITESDNSAYLMLCSILGMDNIREYIKAMGCDFSSEDVNRYWPRTTCRASAIEWLNIYNYKDSGDYGSWYWDLYDEASSRISIALNKTKDCYSKTGSDDYYMNEAGLVLGDEPYIVVILTKSSSSSSRNSYFYQVARAVDKLICS